jgi:hypothetical protein
MLLVQLQYISGKFEMQSHNLIDLYKSNQVNIRLIDILDCILEPLKYMMDFFLFMLQYNIEHHI